MPRKNFDKNLYKLISLRIRELRKQSSISQQTLAKSLGISFQQVAKYENYENKVPIDLLIKISNFFNVGLNYFFQDYEKKINNNDFILWEKLLLLSENQKTLVSNLIKEFT